MMHYDAEYHRQRQRERMAEIRAEYQRVQAEGESRMAETIGRYAQSAWSHMRHVVAHRAPISRA